MFMAHYVRLEKMNLDNNKITPWHLHSFYRFVHYYGAPLSLMHTDFVRLSIAVLAFFGASEVRVLFF